MNDQQLLRYSRHILLDELGVEAQERLASSRALVVGAGGLGSPAVLYLATAGVGHITVVDPDTVDLTNLQRQIAHAQDRLGQPKAESARTAMQALNPDITVVAVSLRADEAWLSAQVAGADVVLDCSDNFETRHGVNAACVRHGVPLVSGAAIRWDGQVSVYDVRHPEAPCYACLFPADSAVEEVRCATMGVFAPLVGVIGSIQAAEALKLLTGAGSPLSGRLLMVDGRSMAFHEVRLPRRPDCPVCSHRSA